MEWISLKSVRKKLPPEAVSAVTLPRKGYDYVFIDGTNSAKLTVNGGGKIIKSEVVGTPAWKMKFTKLTNYVSKNNLSIFRYNAFTKTEL